VWVALSSVAVMIIDCDSCTVRGAACTDCVVTFLTIPVRPAGWAGPAGSAAASPSGARGSAVADDGAGRPVDLDDGERAAIDVLASSGLVPPLRMVRAM
jgi:hypothetical protein